MCIFFSSFFYVRLKMHEEKKTKTKNDDKVPEGAVPAYLLDREGQSRAKVLSNMVKQKRKEKAVRLVVHVQHHTSCIICSYR